MSCTISGENKRLEMSFLESFGKIKCFNENLNGNFLRNDIYRTCLLPTARKHFGRSGEWFLMEDRDPKHQSNITKAWKRKHNVINLPLPALSQDMNPIENLWTLLKTKVLQRKPKTLFTLVKSIKKEWRLFPKEPGTNLMVSMANRVNDLIESHGDYNYKALISSHFICYLVNVPNPLTNKSLSGLL